MLISKMTSVFLYHVGFPDNHNYHYYSPWLTTTNAVGYGRKGTESTTDEKLRIVTRLVRSTVWEWSET